MALRKTILVVDDSFVNRKILGKILQDDYTVIEADNGKTALEILLKKGNSIAAVMLDLVMPVMNGNEFLRIVSESPNYKNIPIIATTAKTNIADEKKALAMGAWDFVTKPYDNEIIKLRIGGAIARSQLFAFEQIRHMAEFDSLTEIYNKSKFFQKVKERLDEAPDKQYVFIRFDIQGFQLINSFFGVEEGDRLLRDIATNLKADYRKNKGFLFGRMEADVFSFLIPNVGREEIIEEVNKAPEMLACYDLAFNIVPCFGLYEIEDHNLPVETMFDRAGLASKSVKGKYSRFYAYYQEKMGDKIANEQNIINDMQAALENGQFVPYFQPKYSLKNNMIIGAEALVRWIHPEKGMISPGEFIPIFERNGFIVEMDYYIWEQVCRLLREWIDSGLNPKPVSVNVSRVNLYNPRLVDNICGLIKKYNLSPSLLQLELTESTYVDNHQLIVQTMARLQSIGFKILMDDFGSGYSSLNVLKDIPVDILKIDMGFMDESSIQGRGKNILASIVRMAQWLNLTVIAEGVEKIDQAEFLRGIGCDYAQGYLYSRPMPAKEYAQLQSAGKALAQDPVSNRESIDDLWKDDSSMGAVFSNALQAGAVYEYSDNSIQIIRVNSAFYELFGYDDFLFKSGKNIINVIAEDYRSKVLDTFKSAVETKDCAECDYIRYLQSGKQIWIHVKLKYISSIDDKHLLIGILSDITTNREIGFEQQKLHSPASQEKSAALTMLVISDDSNNSAEMKRIFKGKYNLIHTDNNQDALTAMNVNNVDIVILDLTSPAFDGFAFLQGKKLDPSLAAIPIVVILTYTQVENQRSSIAAGANDYIIMPFVSEIVERRIANIINSNLNLSQIVREYNKIFIQAQQDGLTGLYNRSSAEKLITECLINNPEGSGAMLMIDVDNFKTINDSGGHDYGDKVLCRISMILLDFFRSEDIIARLGGDEFCVFMRKVSSPQIVMDRCAVLAEKISDETGGDGYLAATCSIGAAMCENEINSFGTLYKNSDIALYDAKRLGKNRCSVFGYETAVREIEFKNVISKNWLLDALDLAVLIIEVDTNLVVYMSDSARKICQVIDYKGKTCYNLVQGHCERCCDCSQSNLNANNFIRETEYVERLNATFVTKDKLIIFNGKTMRLRVITDVICGKSTDLNPDDLIS